MKMNSGINQITKEFDMKAYQRSGLIVEKVCDELVIFNQERNEANALNAAATVVFELCNGTNEVDDMVQAMKANDILPATDDAVLLILGELEDAHLVEIVERPQEKTGRRDILKRVGAGAMAAVLLPVITTITAPEAMAQTSGTTTTTTAVPTPVPTTPSPR